MGDIYGTPRKVTFQYLHSKWNTDDPIQVEFDLTNNEKENDSKIVVGLNGTGKTTLLKLIDEFYSLQKKGHSPTDAEIKKVDQFIKQNTLERFGPVRQVKPELVFEIAFEGIAPSSRHKSGVAVRFPRILRWRHDKKTNDANSLEDLKQLLP